ncbi:MAG: PAS domain-containing sensor histidine kinase [Alphaproteobacteria bacterium]|nr:MAG: PAS domain-containing sensor histidine kinase [Alphaproteobacteria bacterium]
MRGHHLPIIGANLVLSGILFPVALARAQAIEANTADFMIGAALVVTAVATLAAGIHLVRQALFRARHARRAANVAQAMLDSAPVAVVSWDSEGRFRAGARLADWLGLARPPSAFADLLDTTGKQGFVQAEFARLEEAALALRAGKHNVPAFEVSGAGRRFRITGAQVTGAGGARLSALWFEDVTRERDRLDAEMRRADALAADKAALEAMLDAFDFPVWRRGPALGLEWVNAAYVSAVEAGSRAEVVDQGAELVANAISGGGRENAARAQASGRGATQKHYVVIDGQRRAIQVTDIPLVDEGGAIAGYARDVTDLEEARAELARHQESHAETLNKLSTAVAIFGADKTLEFYNSAFLRLWGLPEELLSSRPHHSELLEAMRENRRLPEQADFPAWKRQHLAHYTELLEPLEEMWHLPNSTTLRVVTQPHPLGGLIVLFEDVTDRLALERSYNTLIAVQQATLNNLHEGVAVFGSDGRLRLFNPAFGTIWQLDEEFLSREPHFDEVLDRCAPLFDGESALDDFKARIFSDDTERVVKGGRLSRAGGSEIDYAAVPLPDGATLLTYLDVTDSIRIERALRERNEALETADRLKTEFVAHMSYELRTPLNSVIGFAELLDKEYYGPLNSQQHNYTRNILESSEQLMLLINDILDLAVIEAGGMMLDLGPVDVAGMIKTVAGMVREEIHKREQTLDVDVAEGIGTMEGDERRLKQALFNLLSNAMKFTPPRGHITLGAAAEGDDILFWVADTGTGIAAEEQQNVFERFITGSNAPKGQGAGLGLSLVKNFVELHGGSVDLKSARNKGTRVTCRLPRHQPSTPKPVASVSRAARVD